MKIPAALAIGLFVLASRGMCESAMLFKPNPTVFELARVANHFIGLGEEKTRVELERIWRRKSSDALGSSDLREQLGWICRLVFVAKPGMKIRRPFFGGLGSTFDNLKGSDWPDYPLAEIDGVFFVLAQGYTLGGLPEDPIDYLNVCRSLGVFRSVPLAIPTERGASRALDHLVESERWERIRNWKGGFEVGMNYSDYLRYLRAQTNENG